jgi:phage terminase large subunit-like protein
MTEAPPDLRRQYEMMKVAAEHRRFNKLSFFKPNAKQAAFFAKTKTKHELMLRAGNRLGKSEAGAVLMAYALTGEYPPGWQGRVWKKPIRAWLAGITGSEVRDIQQNKLCGPPDVPALLGSGYIPKEAFYDAPSKKRGLDPPLFDTISIKTKINGRLDDSAVSTLKLKSYENGRANFQGEEVDLIWLDEEDPPTATGDSMAIYSECLARTLTVDGLVYVTFTPLNGATKLVHHYEHETDSIGLVVMSLFDADHLSAEQKERALGMYPEHERRARLFGDPLLGSGAIFNFDENMLRINMSGGQIPLDWRKLWGSDFGEGDHPFAAVLGAIDDDTDTLYLLNCLKMPGTTKLQQIPAMRAIAAGVPVAWPHDMGKLRDAGDGNLTKLADQYRNPGPGMQGLQMLGRHSSWKDGTMSTQAAIDEFILRAQTGRMKIKDGPDMEPLFDEIRNYHRRDGKIVKLNDDLLSAVYKILMMQRFARAVALGSKAARAPTTNRVSGVDHDYYAGLGY